MLGTFSLLILCTLKANQHYFSGSPYFFSGAQRSSSLALKSTEAFRAALRNEVSFSFCISPLIHMMI